MADSVRAFADCIGVGAGEFSVRRDFLGFLRSPDADVSVGTQIQRLKGRHVHMNFIRVGADQFTEADLREIDSALQATRDIYALANLGVGRIEHWVISTAEAGGADNIGSGSEATDLTNDWTVPNSALDIFFVLTYAGDAIGSSPVEGPCNKDLWPSNGSVVAIEGAPTTTGFTLAHEAAHYLGLEHHPERENLMFRKAANGREITSGQASNMRDHCFTRRGC